MIEQKEGFKDNVHEIIRHLMLIESTIIDAPEIQEATISGKRGIFGEPSYKELTIKIKFMEDSAILSEKRKQLRAMVDELDSEREMLVKEIERIDSICDEVKNE